MYRGIGRLHLLSSFFVCFLLFQFEQTPCSPLHISYWIIKSSFSILKESSSRLIRMLGSYIPYNSEKGYQ